MSEMNEQKPLTLEGLYQFLYTQIEKWDKERSAEREERSAEREAAKKAAEERAAAEKKAAEERAAKKKEEEERAATRAAEREREEKKYKADYERQMKELRQQIGGIGKSQGEHAEQFFIRAMKYAMRHSQPFCGIVVEKITPHLSRSHLDIDEEYDILLHNGDGIVIIEVKYKFQMHDLKTFIHRKMNNFRKLFPEYADKTLYLGIAAFSFEPGVSEEAKKLGVAVMQKDGKNIEIDSVNLKTF